MGIIAPGLVPIASRALLDEPRGPSLPAMPGPGRTRSSSLVWCSASHSAAAPFAASASIAMGSCAACMVTFRLRHKPMSCCQQETQALIIN